MDQQSPPLRERLKAVATEAMLDAAERCMIRHGYEQTTMQQIAAEAGCATGTFYLHFKSKEDILRVIFARKIAPMHEKVREAHARERNPLRRLRAGMEAFLRESHKEKTCFKIFMDSFPVRHRHFGRMLDAQTMKDHETLQSMELHALREAQGLGLIRKDLPAEILQEFMQAVCVNLFEHLLNTDAQMSVDRQVEIFWGLIGNGIGAREQAR
jgi:TetR/AcrR family transcriptional regulator, repressor for uid operon